MTMASHCVLDEKAPFLLWLLSTTSRLDEDELATQDDELDQGAAEVAGFSSPCSFSVDEGLDSGVHDDEEVVGAMYSDDDEEDGAGVSSSLPLLSTGSPFRFQICLLVISPARRDDHGGVSASGQAPPECTVCTHRTCHRFCPCCNCPRRRSRQRRSS
jgi:hypothetical protein